MSRISPSSRGTGSRNTGSRSADSGIGGRRRRIARAALLASPVLLVGLVSAAPSYAASSSDPPPTPPATSSGSASGASAAGVDYGAKAAKIALSQVGVKTTPSSTDFGLDCDPYTSMVGPDIPSANGCGVDAKFGVRNENEVWCSDFAKWVWMQAGVTADLNLINAGSNSFRAWALAQGQSVTLDSTDPHVGDAIVFYPPGTVTATTYANHVGIVTAVNSDGTVDLVNGDFRGSDGIGVEHDTHVDLKTWASSVWNKGEQWLFVSPPTTAQKPAPSVSLSGSQHAIVGAPVTFTARAHQRGGKVSSYLWSFQDGGHAKTATASHVFGSAGLHTVALTATSSLGTVSVKTINVMVDAASSTVASTPSVANWYSVTPVYRSVFSQNPAGSLARNVYNGAEWSYEALPGSLSKNTSVTVLNYADPDDDSMQAHAFYRSADGTLAETNGTSDGWKTATLPGHPAADSPIVAATESAESAWSHGHGHGHTTAEAGDGSVTPAVYYFDAHGRLDVSIQGADGWTTSTLPVAPTRDRELALALTAQRDGVATTLFTVDRHGSLVASTSSGSHWSTARVASSRSVDRSTALTALTVGRDGSDAQVLFTGHHGDLQAVTGSGHRWHAEHTGHLPAVQSSRHTGTAGTIGATVNVTTSNQAREDVFYISRGGHVVRATPGRHGWSAERLDATGASITGVADFPEYIPEGEVNLPDPTQTVGRQSETVLVASDSGSTLNAVSTNPRANGWSSTALATSQPAFADSVRLYAATDADYQTALAAAKKAGIPADHVIRSFFTAWDDVLGGRNLVITVGQAATGSLYYNVCGWANPGGEIAGGTPFGYVVAPRTSWPGAELYLDGLAASSSQNANRVTDLAYYATHGSLPDGVTSVPTAGHPSYTCSGAAS